MFEPLNEFLYNALVAKFASVTVANEGGEAVVRYHPDWRHQGRLEAEIVEAGEYYRVNCFLCVDGRQRLWINHRWGVRDPQTGDDNLHLAICYNAGCIDTRDRQRQLQDLLMIPGPVFVRKAPPRRPVVQDFTLPAGSVGIHELPASHPAVAYLCERDFDPHEAWDRWRVHYCEAAPGATPAV